MIKAYQVKMQIEKFFKGMLQLDIDVEYRLDENFLTELGKKTGGRIFDSSISSKTAYSHNPKHVPSKIKLKARALPTRIKVDCTVGTFYLFPGEVDVVYEWNTFEYDRSGPIMEFVNDVLQKDLKYKIRKPAEEALPKFSVDPQAEERHLKSRHDYARATSHI